MNQESLRTLLTVDFCFCYTHLMYLQFACECVPTGVQVRVCVCLLAVQYITLPNISVGGVGVWAGSGLKSLCYVSIGAHLSNVTT